MARDYGVLRACFDAFETSYALFGLIYVGMFVEDDIYFAKHFFWAGLNTFATGITAFRIYQDMIRTFAHFAISFLVYCGTFQSEWFLSVYALDTRPSHNTLAVSGLTKSERKP